MGEISDNSTSIPVAKYMNLPTLSECAYTSNYCEENIWKICEKVIRCPEKYPDESYAVFISNDIKKVLFWNHKICGRHRSVCWDYHVLFIYGNKQDGYVVLDLDSILSFPTPFKYYYTYTFGLDHVLKQAVIPECIRYFRVVPAKFVIEKFSSDRRHMRCGESWLSEPPKYPCIRASDVDHNLDYFVNMNKNGYGTVMNYGDFVKRFSSASED